MKYKPVTNSVIAVGLFATVTTHCAHAQPKYPSKPIRLIVAFTAGGVPDTLARLLGPRVSEALGQPVVIENRAGAGGTIAAGIVAKAAPDGYTLLATSNALAISAALHPNLAYDASKDFSGVVSIGYSTTAVIVSPSLGVKSVKELIALAHAQPGKLLFGSAGAGSGTHISGERFRYTAGIKAVHVAFKGQPEFIIEVVAGRVHFGLASLGSCIPLIKDGKLLPLAVLPNHSPLFPELPALSEILPGAGRDGSQMWLAPAGTPRAALQLISREVARALAVPEVKERLVNFAFHIAPATPEETDRMFHNDIAAFTKVVANAGLRPK